MEPSSRFRRGLSQGGGAESLPLQEPQFRRRGEASLRFEWGCNCLLFYFCGLYCLLHVLSWILRLGPYSPPPAPQVGCVAIPATATVPDQSCSIQDAHRQIMHCSTVCDQCTATVSRARVDRERGAQANIAYCVTVCNQCTAMVARARVDRNIYDPII